MEPIVVERLTRTGSRDTTFSGDGLSLAFLDDPWQGDTESLFVGGVVIDSSGRITVAVESLEYPRNVDRLVLPLTQWEPNGTRRLSFGVGGVAWARRCDEVGGLAVQADRKLVVVGLGADDEPIVGTYAYDPCVTRLNPNGTLDGAFGTDGFTPFPRAGGGSAVPRRSPLRRARSRSRTSTGTLRPRSLACSPMDRPILRSGWMGPRRSTRPRSMRGTGTSPCRATGSSSSERADLATPTPPLGPSLDSRLPDDSTRPSGATGSSRSTCCPGPATTSPGPCPCGPGRSSWSARPPTEVRSHGSSG